MTELVPHSTINKIEMDVAQTGIPNLPDVLCEVMKLMNTNFENSIEKLAKQLNVSKQTTIYFTEDLCRMYKVSESTVYHWRKSGKLQCCDEGQKVWFTQEHIDAFNWLCDSRNKQSTLRKMA